MMGRLLIILILTFNSALWAADISVDMTLDSNQVADGEAIQAEVTVEGTRSSPAPQIENATDFEVHSTGTSTRFQMVNGTVSQSVLYSFELIPKHPGTFTIGPAKVSVNGKVYQSDSKTVQVSKGGGGNSGNEVAGGLNNGQSFQIKADVDNKRPYLNQEMVYTFQLFNRGGMQNAQLSLPDFNGFAKEELEKQRDFEKVINGVSWHINQIKFALFPLAVGKSTIAPAALSGEVIEPGRGGGSAFDSFFNGGPFGFGGGRVRRVRIQSDTLNISTQPFPENGKPAIFSGLVGRFSLKANLSRTSLSVGDSVTLTAEISGDGNVRDAKLPDLAIDGFKTYDDQPSVLTKIEGGKLGGVKTFKRALVPLKAGEFSLPPLSIAYLNPSTGNYQTISSGPLNLKVTPGTGESANYAKSEAAATKNAAATVEDIMPLKVVRNWGGRPLSGLLQAWVWLVLIGCPLVYLGIYTGAYFWRLRQQDQVGTKKRQAYKKFQATISKTYSGSFRAHYSNLLREYLGHKANFDGLASTSADVRKRLLVLKVSAPLTERTGRFLENCERSEYGGGSNNSEDEIGLKQELVALVDALEKEIPI